MTDHPISDTYLDEQVARVSAALPGAGAWDATPTIMPCAGFKSVTLYFRYTRGGAAGAFNFRVDAFPLSAGTQFHQLSLYAPGGLVAGADTTSADQREDITYTAVGAAEELFVFGPIELGGTVERVAVPARETGNAGAPGTLEVLANFSC